MTWNLTAYIGDLMVFDLNFTHPEVLSTLPADLDELVMHIRAPNDSIPIYFMSEEGHPLVNITLKGDIPL